MCGIFGILKTGAIPESILASAVTCLAHRGPDDSGTAIIPTRSGSQLGLVHTRLSIIDLSPLGHQPMFDSITGNCIVYNGEIYNFRELRAELERLGNHFQSHSDTEVLLAAYRAWGDDSFSKLRGMFAFALWDQCRQSLRLVRDPMGIKPLYYFRDARSFLFSSEVRTLLQSGCIPKELDAGGLFSFLTFGSIYEPKTIVQGVSAVPPGHVISIENEGLKDHEYWNPIHAATSEPATSGADAAIRVLPQLLSDAVLSHLVSDVPVGVFLSGGIDSSSLVALMSRAGVRPATFSLVFREEDYNEADYSRAVARRFATDHHEIAISQRDALAALPDALQAMDQPTIDGVNTWLVSAKARGAGVKVALTGLGADEMFAGYSNFRRIPRMERAASHLANLPSAIRRPVAASIALVAEQSDRNRKLSELASAENGLVHPYFLARSLFTASEREALFKGNVETEELELEASLRNSVTASQSLDPVNRVSYLESHWYMRNTLLRDSDFMSMSQGLELRVPFLDRPLVEACFQIPGKEKLRGSAPKSLLLNHLGTELPNEIVHRPKRGFTLPFESWLRADLRPLVDQSFKDHIEPAPGLNSRAAAEVWQRFLEGRTSWSRPWALFVLNHWCRQNL
jgi:asparagine synthase (glutamine-hydrolysing)